MPTPDAPDVTDLIHRSLAGDEGAAEKLFTATCPQLRRLARARSTGPKKGRPRTLAVRLSAATSATDSFLDST